MTLRKHLRLGLALGSAAMLAASLAGCYGSSSSTALQPGLQQSVASVSHETKTQKRAAPPEIINQFVSVPPGTATPTNFEIVLKGNLVNAICGPSNPPCLDQPLYGPYNPFCPPSGGPCYPTVTYNPSTNTTTVEYSGPTLYQNIPGHTNYYHFGLFAGPSSTGSVKGLEVTSYWSYASSPNVPQPIVSINSGNTLQKSANWAYALVFIAVATSPKGPAVYGTWNDSRLHPERLQPTEADLQELRQPDALRRQRRHRAEPASSERSVLSVEPVVPRKPVAPEPRNVRRRTTPGRIGLAVHPAAIPTVVSAEADEAVIAR